MLFNIRGVPQDVSNLDTEILKPTGTVPVLSRQSENEGRYRSRAESLNLIVTVLAASKQPMTRREIAKAIGRRKSPSLTGMLNELAASERIAEIARINVRGNLEFSYWAQSQGGGR